MKEHRAARSELLNQVLNLTFGNLMVLIKHRKPHLKDVITGPAVTQRQYHSSQTPAVFLQTAEICSGEPAGERLTDLSHTQN